MKLTAFTDYCLRVLLFLAVEPSRRATIGEIARAFEVSEHHMVKVVHFLATHGWIETVRGKGGGMTLARPARDIRLGDVVRSTEGHAMPAECFGAGGGNCRIAECCQLKGALATAVDAFYAALDGFTIADISGNRQILGKVLSIHPA